jgi:hypothetical protein
MLDKSKLIAQLHKVADQLFIDNNIAYTCAQDIWRIICADPTFLYKVREVHNPPLTLPLWDDELGKIVPIAKMIKAHVVLSVDGSQIYPDRHNVASCFLINTGSVVLPYLLQNKRVELYSTPKVFAGEDEHNLSFTTDTVNCKRQELELQEGLSLAKRIKRKSNSSDTPLLLLFDGSLIFWHLTSKEREVRDIFLHAYCALLDELHYERIPVAWYISSPKSKELINLVRLYLSNFDLQNKQAYEVVNAVLDSNIVYNFLPLHTRSIVFKNCSSICDYYPPSVRPFFFYVHTGNEIGRVEIPAWIAQDNTLVDFVAEVIIDQCIKGSGYPVALAEAHEQAVIKGPDRDFFYHFLQKMIIEKGRAVVTSRKSLKKRKAFL